jgi:hypothetical protein
MTTSDDDSAEREAAPAKDGISIGGGSHFATGAISINTVDNLIARSYTTDKKEERFFWRSSPRQRLKRTLDKALGQAPDDAMGVLISLIADCDLRAYDTRRLSKRWGSAYYSLGLPAAVLATIAGAAGLASTAGRIPAAIVALIAAGLATAATFLNSNENKQQNLKLSAAWQELADDVRLTVIKYSRAKDEELSRYDYLIGDVIYFNKRKGALLRGDLASMPERPPLKN